MAANLRDEEGHPIQLTDEMGNPVQLTDEHGQPMHLTGVASTELHEHQHATPYATAPTTVGGTGGRTFGDALASEGGQCQPMRPTKEELPSSAATLASGDIKRSGSSSSSSTSSEDEGQEGHEGQGTTGRKKKGLKEKIKEKLTGGGKHKDKDHVAHHTTSSTKVSTTTTIEHHEHDENKKGFLERIKEKLPGTTHH